MPKAEKNWVYSELELFPSYKVQVPYMEISNIDYGKVYQMEWQGEQNEVYELELGTYIYTGAIEETEVHVYSGSEAFERCIWYIGRAIAQHQKSVKIQETERISSKDIKAGQGGIELTEVVFTNGGSRYKGYVRMNGYGEKDRLIFYKESADNMVQTILQTLQEKS